MGRYTRIGSVETVAPAYAAAIELNPTESVTVVNLALLTGNVTLNIGANAKPVTGDRMIVKAISDGTARNVTFGTGFTCPVLPGSIGKTKVQELYYDGTNWKPVSSPVLVD